VWCTADIGWITGHSYIVYGPLANGATSLMFEGVPTYPEPDRYWQVCEKYRVTGFYTAPTVIRALMRLGDRWTRTRDLSALRILGTVGEPINPDVWLWYYEKIGGERCPVLDTWWQTETGGVMITPVAGATPMKPGSASMPFPGVVPAVLREDGTEAAVDEPGFLVIKDPWPGMLRTVWQDHDRYIETYWSQFPGVYLTGDGCSVDDEGYYWVQGRIDDVINVSGHRIGTAEVESAAVSHPAVAEAAVVGFPHNIKGQGIYVFASLKEEYESSYAAEEKIASEVSRAVADAIGPFARPDIIQFTAGLPKTRSGKIMRRILRKIVEGKTDEFGDISTLADADVLEELMAGARRALDEFDYDAHLQVILAGYPYECKEEEDKLVGTVCVHRHAL
jgi:acetyl-CoA synthetase